MLGLRLKKTSGVRFQRQFCDFNSRLLKLCNAIANATFRKRRATSMLFHPENKMVVYYCIYTLNSPYHY